MRKKYLFKIVSIATAVVLSLSFLQGIPVRAENIVSISMNESDLENEETESDEGLLYEAESDDEADKGFPEETESEASSAAFEPDEILLEEGYADSGRTSVSKLSMDELVNLYQSITTYSELYQQEPDISGTDYHVSTLTTNAVSAAEDYINYYRLVAGLSEITMTEALNTSAAYGALVLAMDDVLSHYPSQPADMSDEDYQLGYYATGKSNLSYSWGYSISSVIRVAIQGQMADKSSSNLTCHGHRRWLLNPNAVDMGVGTVNNSSNYYTAIRVFGNDMEKQSVSDYDFIAWPSSGNNLSDTFAKDVPWSITLNPNKYSTPSVDEVKVVISHNDETWTFDNSVGTTESATSSYFTINNLGYGIANCIIFRPAYSGFTEYSGEYVVTVSGISDKSGNAATLNYKVNFDSVKNLTASPSPSASPSATSSASAGATPSTEPSATSSASAEATPSASPSATSSASAGATPSTEPSATSSASAGATPSASPSATSSASAGATPSASPSVTSSASAGATSSASPSVTPSTEPSATSSASAGATPSASPSVTSSASAGATPSASPSAEATASASPDIDASPVATPSPDTPIEIGEEYHIAAKGKIDVGALIREQLDNPYLKISKFTSSDKKIATVSGKGIVTGKADGTVTITAYTKTSGSYMELASVKIKVSKPVFKITDDITYLGCEMNLSDYIQNLPEEVPVMWSIPTSRLSTTEFDSETGLITPYKAGSIKVTCMIGEGKYAAKYTSVLKVKLPKLKEFVTVKQNRSKTVSVTNLSSYTEIYWCELDSASRKVIAVTDTSKRNVKKITGISSGTAQLTAIIDGVPYTVIITVP